MERTTTVWETARGRVDLQARDDLLMKHMRLVHHVARQVIRTTSADVELQELVSAGTFGLMDAIESFDPSRGLAFSTFAAPRIRGSVLDHLRKGDHAPRSIRKKQREMARAHDRLVGVLGRSPTHEELAEELGIELTDLWRWQRDTETAGRVSLDAAIDPHKGTQATPRDILVGDDGLAVEDDLTRQEEVRILRDEILNLKEQERIVLSLYYFEDLKLHEIATILGVTESRISQIRSKAITNLRARLVRLREE